MTVPVWKLLPQSPAMPIQVAWREWSDGRQESVLVTAPEYLAGLADGNTPLPADAPTPEELLAAANAAKEQALANLTVTVGGMTLKADSEARQNMADAIRAAETLRALPVEQAAAALGLTVEQVEQYGGIETLTAAKPWKLADKTVAVVTLEQLKLASFLAIFAVGNLVIP